MKTETKVQNEIWKPIKDFEESYEVSNLGRVKTIEHLVKNGNGHRRVRCRILKLRNNGTGYHFVGLGRGVQRTVHRLVATAFLENIKNKEFVNHKDGVKTNNNVSNLEWCTRQENEDHAFRTGLKNHTGVNNAMSKLTDEMVYKIKFVEKGLIKEIAEKYPVHRATIGRIKQGLIWKHITK